MGSATLGMLLPLLLAAVTLGMPFREFLLFAASMTHSGIFLTLSLFEFRSLSLCLFLSPPLNGSSYLLP